MNDLTLANNFNKSHSKSGNIFKDMTYHTYENSPNKKETKGNPYAELKLGLKEANEKNEKNDKWPGIFVTNGDRDNFKS